MDSDALAGAAVGLVGLAIAVDIAGKVLKKSYKPVKLKPTKLKKMKW